MVCSDCLDELIAILWYYWYCSNCPFCGQNCTLSIKRKKSFTGPDSVPHPAGWDPDPADPYTLVLILNQILIRILNPIRILTRNMTPILSLTTTSWSWWWHWFSTSPSSSPSLILMMMILIPILILDPYNHTDQPDRDDGPDPPHHLQWPRHADTIHFSWSQNVSLSQENAPHLDHILKCMYKRAYFFIMVEANLLGSELRWKIH